MLARLKGSPLLALTWVGLPFLGLVGACVGDTPVQPTPDASDGGGNGDVVTVSDAPAGDSTMGDGGDGGPPAATGTLLWAGAAPGSLLTLPTDVAIDAAGNVVVLGYYASGFALDFGNGKTLPATGTGEAFVVKFDATGVCQWAVGVTSAAEIPLLRGLAIDPSNGDIVFSGQFAGSVQVGSGTTRVSNGMHDILVAKLSSTGAEKWVKSYGGGGNDAARDVAVDASGRAVFAGSYVRSTGTDISFDGKVANPPQNTAMQGLVVSLDTAGTAQWVKALTISGPSGAYASVVGVTLDADGNVILGGEFQETMQTNNGQLPAKTISSAGHRGGFVMKLDGTTGITGWANAITGAGGDYVTCVAVDGKLNAIAGLQYTGALTIGNRNLNTFGMQDIAYARYDSSGALLDSHEFGTANTDELYGIAVDAWGEVILGGTEPSTIDFGLPATGKGNTDGFVVKFDPQGAALWAYGIGGVNADVLGAVDVNPSGNIAFAANLTGNGSVATKTFTFDGGPFSSALYGVFGP